MNCRIFSELVSDVARDQIMEASARAQAISHAAECLNCARRLETEGHLTSQLRDLLSDGQNWNASARVWSNLSAAFDDRATTPLANNRRWYYAAAAIAAMILVALSIVSINRPRIGPEVKVPIAKPAEPNPAPATALTPKDEPVKPAVATIRRTPQAKQSRQLARSVESAPQPSPPKEVVTDFIQLTFDDSGLGGDAQLVRVELPRSAMASFGLPVNVDRADQRVKADVLLGADGLAHAIRFVQ